MKTLKKRKLKSLIIGRRLYRRSNDGGIWKRYCLHTKCPNYKGKDIQCDHIGKFCEIKNSNNGLPGYYEKDEEMDF